jgi:tetratricopeptide (TPR) repeat protein
VYPPAEAALAYALRLQADKATDNVQKKLNYAEAERMFLLALKHDPAVRDINGESVYAVLGGLYKNQGRIKDAIEAYHAAESVTPQNSYPIVNLAMLHFMQGNVKEAEDYFKRSIAISARTLDGNPFDYWTRFDLTTALLVTGNLTEAKRHLTIAIQGLQSRSPLEIFLADLQRMKTAPYPPENIDELIEQAQQGLNKLTSETLESARS